MAAKYRRAKRLKYFMLRLDVIWSGSGELRFLANRSFKYFCSGPGGFAFQVLPVIAARASREEDRDGNRWTDITTLWRVPTPCAVRRYSSFTSSLGTVTHPLRNMHRIFEIRMKIRISKLRDANFSWSFATRKSFERICIGLKSLR